MLKIMPIEHASGSLLEAPPESEDESKSVENTEPQLEKTKEIEVHLIDHVLREQISRKLSGKFEQSVKKTPPDMRGEALLDFKASYLKQQMSLANAVTETKKIIHQNPDITADDLVAQINVSTLENEERAQLREAARVYEQQAKDLKTLIRDSLPDEEKIFSYLTEQKVPAWGMHNFTVERKGNNLICFAEPVDFKQLYAGNATGEERQRLTSQAQGAAGFHRVERRKHPAEGHELTFHTIGINRGFEGPWGDVIHYHPDDLGRAQSHELQHAFDSHLELDRGRVELNFPFREDLEKHLSAYVGGYLDHLRDEAIAYAIEGHGRSLAEADYQSPNASYLYPKKSQLEVYRKLLGDEKFEEWRVKEIWEEKVVTPFRYAADHIARISARLASTPSPQRAKLAALFEIEPAKKWQRLERWLDDPEVKRSVGRGLPKLALLPKKHQKLV